MEYDSRKVRKVEFDSIKCPFCKSTKVKKYIYGTPAYFDQDKYISGGSVINLGKPRPDYRCSDCEKDIFVSARIDLSKKEFDKEYETIFIGYTNNDYVYDINLLKGAIMFRKLDYNDVYAIDGYEKITPQTFDKYYNKLIEITSNWMKEFDNDELVPDDETIGWGLVIDTHDSKLLFNETKVPSNMIEFKNVVKELEEMYLENIATEIKNPHFF